MDWCIICVLAVAHTMLLMGKNMLRKENQNSMYYWKFILESFHKNSSASIFNEVAAARLISFKNIAYGFLWDSDQTTQ